MSTPDSPGRHHAGTSTDPWPSPAAEPNAGQLSGNAPDGRGSLYDRGDGYDSPYYSGLRDIREERDSAYGDDVPYDRSALEDEPSSRAVRHLLSALLCLVLTPIGIAAMTYGADRYWQLTLEQAGAERDPRGLIALGVGTGLLLIVACLGALSAVGPLLSGVIWGLAPAGIYLAYPQDTASEISDLPVLPDFALSGAVTWLGYAVFLLAGTLLVGAGAAAAMRRPR